MIKVFISSPYTLGSQIVNVRRQIDASNELMNLGYCPFVPLLYHFQEMVHERPYESWIAQCLDWVGICDCVLRLEGESHGADLEVAKANELGKKVFSTVEELHSYYYEMIKAMYKLA